MTWLTLTKNCNIYLLKKKTKEKEKCNSRISVHFQIFLLVFNFTDALIANFLLGLNFIVLTKSTKSVKFNAHEI